MPLSAEQVYNELNGEEVKEILFTRLADLLNRVPEFRRHLTLPRVRMTLSIHLDIVGRNPPTLEYTDDLVVRMRDAEYTPGEENSPDYAEPETIAHDLTANVIADTTIENGQPPDLIREEHGLPILEPQRGAFGIEDVPIVRPGVRYAAFIKQDYGPARGRTGAEGPMVGGEVIAVKGQGKPDVSANPMEKVKDPNYTDMYKPGDVNHS